MHNLIREEEYVELIVSMSEKTEDELCAIVESRRMDDIIIGYLVLLLNKVGMSIQEAESMDFSTVFRNVTAREAQALGKLYNVAAR